MSVEIIHWDGFNEGQTGVRPRTGDAASRRVVLTCLRKQADQAGLPGGMDRPDSPAVGISCKARVYVFVPHLIRYGSRLATCLKAAQSHGRTPVAMHHGYTPLANHPNPGYVNGSIRPGSARVAGFCLREYLHSFRQPGLRYMRLLTPVAYGRTKCPPREQGRPDHTAHSLLLKCKGLAEFFEAGKKSGRETASAESALHFPAQRRPWPCYSLQLSVFRRSIV